MTYLGVPLVVRKFSLHIESKSQLTSLARWKKTGNRHLKPRPGPSPRARSSGPCRPFRFFACQALDKVKNWRSRLDPLWLRKIPILPSLGLESLPRSSFENLTRARKRSGNVGLGHQVEKPLGNAHRKTRRNASSLKGTKYNNSLHSIRRHVAR